MSLTLEAKSGSMLIAMAKFVSGPNVITVSSPDEKGLKSVTLYIITESLMKMEIILPLCCRANRTSAKGANSS